MDIVKNDHLYAKIEELLDEQARLRRNLVFAQLQAATSRPEAEVTTLEEDVAFYSGQVADLRNDIAAMAIKLAEYKAANFPSYLPAVDGAGLFRIANQAIFDGHKIKAIKELREQVKVASGNDVLTSVWPLKECKEFVETLVEIVADDIYHTQAKALLARLRSENGQG